MVLPVVIAAFLVLWLMRWKLQVMSLGEEEARSWDPGGQGEVHLYTGSYSPVASSVSVTGVVAWHRADRAPYGTVFTGD